jgi:hypothetical protein
MNAHVIETTMPETGLLPITGSLIPPGVPIEVIIIDRSDKVPAKERKFTMRGLPYAFIDPTQPVGADDWDALK